MKTLQTTSEVLVIGGFVVAAHFALVSPTLESGLESAGSAGADLLQVMASNASVAALVQTWDQPPETIQQTEVPTTPTPPDIAAAPAISSWQSEAVQASPEMALQLSPAPDAPPLPVAAPAQPPKMATLAPDVPPAAPIVQKQEAQPPAPMEKPAMPDLAKLSTPAVDSLPKPPQPEEPPKPKTQPAPKPAPKPEKTAKVSAADSLHIQARQAEGHGDKGSKGDNGAEETATHSAAKRKSLAKKWGLQIRKRIAQNAPRGVGKGRALVQFRVAADGRVSGIKLVKSSGNKRIDAAALKSVRLAGTMPKAPKGLGAATLPMQLPISSK